MSIASPSDTPQFDMSQLDQRRGSGSYSRAASKHDLIPEMLAGSLLAVGIVLSILVAPWSSVALACGAASSALVVIVLFLARFSRTTHGIAVGIVALALLVLSLVGLSALRVAAAGLANTFIDAWNAQVDGYVLHFAVLAVPDPAAVAFSLFVGLAVGLVVHVLCLRRFRVLVVLIVVLLVGAGLFFQTISATAFVCLVLGGLMLVSRYSLRAGMMLRHVPVFAVTVAVVMGIVLVACAGYQGNDALRTAKEDALAAFDEFRFGSDTLPQGDLTQAHKMNVSPTDEPTDRVDVAFVDEGVPRDAEPLYLRGFVGTTYTGTTFERLQPADYEGDWTGLFNWLDAHGFKTLSQYAAYRTVDDELADGSVSTTEVKVSPQGAYRRYAYAPTSATSAGAGELLDLYRASSGFGAGGATFSVVEDGQTAETVVPGEWVYEQEDLATVGQDGADPLQGFLRSEMAYRSFVYDHYLDVPDEVAGDIDQFFFAEDEGRDDATLYSTLTRIRTMLDVSCDHNEQGVRFEPRGAGSNDAGADGGSEGAVAAAGNDSDYVLWFLQDVREGNSSAFASAAVLAFRQAGVPARYAEGYLLGEDKIEHMRTLGTNECSLNEADTHAWVEVYVDGAGWMPVEVTPGFYDRVYSSDETVEIAREVAGAGSDDANTGALGEELPDWTEQLPEELRPFAWIGLVLLVVLILLFLVGLLELQRLVRLRMYDVRLRTAREQGVASVVLFGRMERLIEDAGVPFDAATPRACAAALARARGEVHPAEYQRVLALMERERYGRVPFEDFEMDIVASLLEKLEAGNWERATLPRRLVYRYLGLYLIPLRTIRP